MPHGFSCILKRGQNSFTGEPWMRLENLLDRFAAGEFSQNHFHSDASSPNDRLSEHQIRIGLDQLVCHVAVDSGGFGLGIHLCTSTSSVLDCRYEIKNRLNLLSCDPRKPPNELFNGGAVLKVLEECPNRHSRFGEDLSAADLGWVLFDCSALISRVHGSPLTRLRFA